jgi:hypothetical protein
MSAETQPAAPAQPKRWAKLQRIVILGVGAIAVLLYGSTFVVNLFTLPGCDSKRARDTLSDVFKANKVSASGYDEVKTIADNKDEIRCRATLSLREGGKLTADYRFFWDGSSPKIEYKLIR